MGKQLGDWINAATLGIARWTRAMRALTNAETGSRPASGRVRIRRHARSRRRAAMLELLEDRALMAGMPFGALADDTGEYMLGDIAVAVVLMESDSTLAPHDNSTEDWIPVRIQDVKDRVQAAFDWWKGALNNVSPAMAANLNFIPDYTYADNPVRTGYEPIARKSNDFQSWMYDFLRQVGYAQTGDFSTDIRAYNNALRQQHNANWAFTILVVNSTNDPDDSFAAGGSFSRAFSYAGGRFIVVPSERPASTYAHEIGHQFWARDEYSGEDWTTKRGYYNTQNSNAPHTGYTSLPSIMSSNTLLNQAWTNSALQAPVTLDMIGWRDSDNDGIFDVLDVPLTLTGSGRYNPSTGIYRFTGTSKVQTLPNLNSSGPRYDWQNDMTINKVSRAEYRIDGGAWATIGNYDADSVSLDVSILVPGTATKVEIRTIDVASGVTSPIFEGLVARPTSVVSVGINGFVYQDADVDTTFDNSEAGLGGWAVQVIGADGQPLPLRKTLNPDSFPVFTSLTNSLSGVRLSASGTDASNVVVAVDSGQSAAGRAFGSYSNSLNDYVTTWRAEEQRLRMDFTSPVSTLSLDAIADDSGDYARLEIYDVNNNLLGRYTTQSLAAGAKETMTLTRPTADISYAIARGYLGTDIVLDNLRFGPETSVTTDSSGAYSLGPLPAGTYKVHVEPPAGWTASGPAPADATVVIGEGEALSSVDFAAQGSQNPWNNASNPLDVNADGFVAPGDALLVINDLNRYGSRQLGAPAQGASPPPYLDVSGDGFLSPVDALLIINYLNRQPSSPTAGGQTGGGATGGAANGEGDGNSSARPASQVGSGAGLGGGVGTSGSGTTNSSTSTSTSTSTNSSTSTTSATTSPNNPRGGLRAFLASSRRTTTPGASSPDVMTPSTSSGVVAVSARVSNFNGANPVSSEDLAPFTPDGWNLDDAHHHHDDEELAHDDHEDHVDGDVHDDLHDTALLAMLEETR